MQRKKTKLGKGERKIRTGINGKEEHEEQKKNKREWKSEGSESHNED